MEVSELSTRFDTHHASTKVAIKALADKVEAQAPIFKGFEERLDQFETEMKRPPAPGDGRQAGNHREFNAAVGRFVRTGDESAFRNVMESGSDPAGGYIVNPVVSKTWTKKIFDASVMRQVSRVEAITQGDAWSEPIDWGQPGVVWVGARQARPETDNPTLAELSVPVSEVYSLQAVTQRLADDAGIDVGAWVEGKITEKMGVAESEKCVSGSGVGQPKGFTSYDVVATLDETRAYGKLQYVPSGAATAVTADGLRNMFWTLRSPHRANAVWMMNSNSANAIDLLKNGQGDYLWRNSSAAGVPPTLLGHEVRFEESMGAIAANSVSAIAFGDFKRGYLIVDKAGVRFLRDQRQA